MSAGVPVAQEHLAQGHHTTISHTSITLKSHKSITLTAVEPVAQEHLFRLVWAAADLADVRR